MAKAIFTNQEIKFIVENYSLMDTNKIAKLLGKTSKQVKGKADNLKLRKGKIIYKYTPFEEDFIKRHYNLMPTGDIAKVLNRTVKQVNDKAYNLGLKRELLRYKYDESFFERIDTEEKAYWLGFLYADGCISQIFNKETGALKGKTLELTLAAEDKEHLNKFKICLKTNKTINRRETKTNGKSYISYRIQIFNKKICDDLIAVGCIPNKSLKLKFPSQDILPRQLRHHFIRGYIDGDGCISTDFKYTYVVNVVGTGKFLQEMMRLVNEETGLAVFNLKGKGKAYQVAWGGFHNFEKWFNYLYKDATIYLDRKHGKFREAITKKEYIRDVAYYHRNVNK